MAWTYSGNPADSSRDAVRMWIGDTDQDYPKIMDEEIDYILTLSPNPLRAAAQACLSIALGFARQKQVKSKSVSDLSISYSDQAQQYRDMAAAFEARADAGVSAAPYSGGISKADKDAVNQDGDRVRPAFADGQFDNPFAIQPDAGTAPRADGEFIDGA